MVRVLAYVVANVVAVLAVGTIAPRWVVYESEAAIFVFALILGFINAFIRPVLRFLTLPLTCLTFGLFALVLNVLLFGLAAWLTPGLAVELWGAVLGSIIASLASGFIFSVVDEG